MAEYDIPSRGFDPTGTLLRALQFSDLAKQQAMRPEQELMQYQRLLPLLESLPPEEAAQIEQKFLGTSTFAPQRAGKLKESYRKDMESNAMLKLADMEHQFRARADAELSRLEQLSQRFPQMDLKGAEQQLMESLNRERAAVMQNFQRDYRNVLGAPNLREAYGRTQSQFGPGATQFEFSGVPKFAPGTSQEEMGKTFRGLSTAPMGAGPRYLQAQQARAGINPLTNILDPNSPEARQLAERAKLARPDDRVPQGRRDVTVPPLEGAYRQRQKRYVPTPEEQMNTPFFGL